MDDSKTIQAKHVDKFVKVYRFLYTINHINRVMRGYVNHGLIFID